MGFNSPLEDQQFIFKALTNVVGKAHQIKSDINDLKIIVFSDHHRGRKDGADDFIQCEDTYANALKYYIDQEHQLILLGDIEEFWENTPKQVMDAYVSILDLEAEFYHQDRYIRVWGNHDDLWSFNDAVKKYLDPCYGGLNVYEAVTIQLSDHGNILGNILMVHGHQGTLLSEKLGGFSRLMVRHVWRNLQRVFKISTSTPSKSVSLKSALDKVMYNWANSFNNQIIICGHTHDAIFMSSEEIVGLNREIRDLKMKLRNKNLSESSQKEIREKIDERRKRITHFKDMAPNMGGSDLRKPLYFNTGCCSYSDGSITGIEICDGHIRLVEWSNPHQKEPFVLADRDLLKIYRQDSPE